MAQYGYKENLEKISVASSTELAEKYTKPNTGIPSTDLSSEVQASITKADESYKKPDTGIPASDLASGVVNDATITIKTNSGTTVDSFTTNQSSNKDITLPELGKVDDVQIDGTTIVSDKVANITKAGLGISNVEDKSSATIRGEITSGNVTTALGYTPYNSTNPNNYIDASGAPVQSVASKTGAVTLVKGDVGLDNVDNTSDANKPISTATQSALDAITGKIPSEASTSNQLADKEFVNSSISTETAHYISNNGQPFTSVAQLEAYSGTVTNNDYAFVTGQDEAGNTYYDRYKASVSGSTVTWAKEYRLNNSSFTAAQWASISSGITSELVSNYNTHIASTSNPHGVTASQVGLGNVGNFKAVSTVANQGLTDTEKSNARANIGVSSGATQTTCTLPVSGWTSDEITVSCTGVTVSNTVWVGPAPSSLEEYAECKIYCTAQASDSLTFKRDSANSNALTVNIVLN